MTMERDSFFVTYPHPEEATSPSSWGGRSPSRRMGGGRHLRLLQSSSFGICQTQRRSAAQFRCHGRTAPAIPVQRAFAAWIRGSSPRMTARRWRCSEAAIACGWLY